MLQVTSEEQPFDPSFPRRPSTVVALASDAVPTSLAFAGKRSFRFLAVARTTLEDGVANTTAASLATADLARYSKLGAADLREQHDRAWRDVWGLEHNGTAGTGGGVEVEGNATLGAAINASMCALALALALAARPVLPGRAPCYNRRRAGAAPKHPHPHLHPHPHTHTASNTSAASRFGAWAGARACAASPPTRLRLCWRPAT